MESEIVCLTEGGAYRPPQRLKRLCITRFDPMTGWTDLYDDGNGPEALAAMFINSLRDGVEITTVT